MKALLCMGCCLVVTNTIATLKLNDMEDIVFMVGFIYALIFKVNISLMQLLSVTSLEHLHISPSAIQSLPNGKFYVMCNNNVWLMKLF